MKYYVKKTGEAFYSEMTFDELQTGFKTRRIAPDWSVRREDDGDYDWVTVQQMIDFGVPKPTARQTLNRMAKPRRPHDFSSKASNFLGKATRLIARDVLICIVGASVLRFFLVKEGMDDVFDFLTHNLWWICIAGLVVGVMDVIEKLVDK